MLFAWSRRAFLTIAGASAFALALDPHSHTHSQARAAAGEGQPQGAAILTFAGDIAVTNRAAFDPKLDGFMKYHEIDFTRAFAFDIAMLEDFPMREIKCQPPQYSSPVVFEGPLLQDVLKALGAEGASIQTRALDGYTVDLTQQEIAAKDWSLATRIDGRPLGIGGRGPLWMIHTPSTQIVPEEEEQYWPWALFYIHIIK